MIYTLTGLLVQNFTLIFYEFTLSTNDGVPTWAAYDNWLDWFLVFKAHIAWLLAVASIAKLSQVPAAAKLSWAEVSFIISNCPPTHPGK